MLGLNKQIIPLLTLNLIVFTGQSEAADSEASDKSSSQLQRWTSEAELGFVSTTGNTEANTINAKGKVTSERDKWRLLGQVSALNTSDSTGTTAERYELKAKSDYKVSKQNYFFAQVLYENDRFSGYSYQISEALGYGRRFIDAQNLKLDIELGPGARHSKLEDGSNKDEFIVLGATNIAWQISQTSKFSEEFSMETGDGATVTKSYSALTTQIKDALAMKISYKAKHTSEVPPAIKKTDTEAAVTLVYSFGL